MISCVFSLTYDDNVCLCPNAARFASCFVAKGCDVDTPSIEAYLCVHEHVYTWCQEGWHDISCHAWPHTLPRTVLAVALLREDARAIINLKAIEWSGVLPATYIIWHVLCVAL